MYLSRHGWIIPALVVVLGVGSSPLFGVEPGEEAGQPPTITSLLQDTANVGGQWSYRIMASNKPDLFGAEVTATGVTLDSINDQTGEIVVSIAPDFDGSDFSMTIFAENSHGRDERTVEVTVTTGGGEEGQAPVIGSPLEIEAIAGEELIYEIAASGTVTFFGATVNTAGVVLESFDNQTGEIRVTIAPGFMGDTFLMTISAENEYGKDEQTVTVSVTNDGSGEIGEPGPAQVMEASIGVREPAVDKINLMLYSTFSFRGKVRTQGDEQEGKRAGTFFAPITESRVTNRDILQSMKESGLIETVEGFKLAMEASLGEDTATLVAVNKKDKTGEEEDVIVPVPEDMLAVRFGEDEQGITGYAGETVEGEPIITRFAGYERVEVDWLKSYGSTQHARLTGIGRFKAKRKNVSIEGEPNVYNAFTRSAAVSGFNSGEPWVEEQE
jgi:hypothetical protein